MEAYRTVYRLIYYIGQKQAAVIGVGVIIILTLLGGEMFSAAIPYGTLWVLFCGSMRLLILILPRPPTSSADFVPSEKPLPKAALAVSITEAHAPDACPDEATMVSRLPDNVRGLIR